MGIPSSVFFLTVFRKSDPFCVVTLGSDIKRTETIPDTLDPVWDCHLEFSVNPKDPFHQFMLEVYDADTVGKVVFHVLTHLNTY